MTALECLWLWVAGPSSTLHPFLIYSDLCLHVHMNMSCFFEHVRLHRHMLHQSALLYVVLSFSPYFLSPIFHQTLLNLTETKTDKHFRLFHCTSLQCCFLLFVKSYVCFAHSGNSFVFNMSYQICHFISIC